MPVCDQDVFISISDLEFVDYDLLALDRMLGSSKAFARLSNASLRNDIFDFVVFTHEAINLARLIKVEGAYPRLYSLESYYFRDIISRSIMLKKPDGNENKVLPQICLILRECRQVQLIFKHEEISSSISNNLKHLWHAISVYAKPR